MYPLVTLLILISSILLVLVVLVQNSKGGGLASNFSASNQIMGVKKTSDFLEKATWTLAILILGLSLLSIFALPKNVEQKKDDTLLRDNMNKPSGKPANTSFPTAPQKQ